MSLSGTTFYVVDKVDSSRAAAATSGALLQNLSSYINDGLVNLSTAFQESNDYISDTFGVPPTVVYGSLAALVAVPITMSRYGWSLKREGSSPYSSMSGGPPKVTEADYSYITSQDLDQHLGTGNNSTDRHYRRSPTRREDDSKDDVLLIKNKGVTYPAHFPARSIPDRKLCVKDVRKRVGLMMGLTERLAQHIKLLYKGKQLKDSHAPVADYNVKNNSELMAVVPDNEVNANGSADRDERVPAPGPAPPKEEEVEVNTRRRKKKRSGKKKGSNTDESGSTRDSASNADTVDPAELSIKQLNELTDLFKGTYLPMCESYIASPPSDPKKREDEHCKISETIMQHVILKTDGIASADRPEIRARRKQLVRDAQDALKKLDAAKAT